MKSFLEYVAEDILTKYGTDLSQVTVVFPNKRASLFLNDHLTRLAGKPLWSPSFLTISELFSRLSPLQVADPVKLVCDLYRSYAEQTGTDETLDHFFGWGQVLLSDFDDIDKNMANPDRVFANLRDIHELDGLTYLTDNQKEALARFFATFTPDHDSLLRERFLRLWSRMGDIYHDFNERLLRQQLAYEGAMYRRVADSLADSTGAFDDIRCQHYLFVGFNVLHEVEQRLFTHLRREGKARFYWDYDRYYLQHNEAGHYIAQYLSAFPNELDETDAAIYDQFSQPKTIRYVSATTENVQARYIRRWLERTDRADHGRRTAVVLCNEALLPAVVHSLPDSVPAVNITTGYPLSQSPAASFVRLLVSLQTQGYIVSRDQFRLHHVKSVLSHPCTACLSPQASQLLKELTQRHLYYPTRQDLTTDAGLALLFGTPVSDNDSLLGWLCSLLQTVARQAPPTDQLFQESLFRTYTLLNRLHALVKSGDLTVDIVTLQRLVLQLVAATTIPFHGEPADGLQIMGVLETRNLDFDHLLLLSANEGNMPKGINDTSFIPYNIRKAYGLTTIDHKVSIYSYYFHRLLQRCADVTIVYNHATTDGQTGEMSRFMLQLMVESPHHIHLSTLQSGQQLQPTAPQPVEKTPAVLQRLIAHFDAGRQPRPSDRRPLLTPTGINRYLRCPLQFYYVYACDLRENDNTDDDSIDNRVFGNIFHEASRLVYTSLLRQSPHVTAAGIDRLLKQGAFIERCVDEAIRGELFKSSSHYVLNGLQIISRQVIIHYLRLLLKQDMQLAPFTIIGLECDVVEEVRVKCGTTTFTSLMGGRIDRLDSVVETNPETQQPEQRIRVVDYKTGSTRLSALPALDAVFQQDYLARHSDYYLQTMLYACQVRRSPVLNRQQLPVSPALLFIQHATADPVLHFGKTRINDVGDYEEPFGRQLQQLIDEIFDPDVPFTPTTDRTRCARCPYKELCAVMKK